MRIEILDDQAVVMCTIIADSTFAEQNYPGKWRVANTPQQDTTPDNPTEWLIDVGPFFDRFGVNKMNVLTNTDPGVKAILADLQVRKWIDLKRSDVAQGLSYVGAVVPAVTTDQQNKILNDPVQPEENLALRRLFFS